MKRIPTVEQLEKLLNSEDDITPVRIRPDGTIDEGQSHGAAPAVPGQLRDLELERAKRSGDNTQVSVEHLLRMALEDVEALEVKPTKAFLMFVVEGADERYSNHYYRAGVTALEEAGMATWAVRRAMERCQDD